MLAHLKAKHRELNLNNNADAAADEPPVAVAASSCPTAEEFYSPEDKNDTQVTCDVLCSLSASYPAGMESMAGMECMESPESSITGGGEKRKSKSSCPKQHQLPMFLSKTYHMIDRCDQTIATWSAAGDNFVVKNVEKFASNVLPLYFKHSNFSSFARQLNFYGFRKLRTDPILTSDVDPRTACYVRFYHEKFQKDRSELLHQIKRATKSDQQSKDDVESLKVEVCRLKDCIGQMSSEMDRKLAEMSYEYNRRITNLSAEYDKLAALVSQILGRQQQQELVQQPLPPPVLHHPQPTAPQQQHQLPITTCTPQVALAPPPRVPDLMHSLSQVAAMSLQNQLRPLSSAAHAPISAVANNGTTGSKRSATEEAGSSSSRARTG